MEMNLSDLDLDSLRDLYSKECLQLERSLLNGASCNDLDKKQESINKLSIEIFNKLYSNPAEADIRHKH